MTIFCFRLINAHRPTALLLPIRDKASYHVGHYGFLLHFWIFYMSITKASRPFVIFFEKTTSFDSLIFWWLSARKSKKTQLWSSYRGGVCVCGCVVVSNDEQTEWRTERRTTNDPNDERTERTERTESNRSAGLVLVGWLVVVGVPPDFKVIEFPASWRPSK